MELVQIGKFRKNSSIDMAGHIRISIADVKNVTFDPTIKYNAYYDKTVSPISEVFLFKAVDGRNIVKTRFKYSITIYGIINIIKIKKVIPITIESYTDAELGDGCKITLIR